MNKFSGGGYFNFWKTLVHSSPLQGRKVAKLQLRAIYSNYLKALELTGQGKESYPSQVSLKANIPVQPPALSLGGSFFGILATGTLVSTLTSVF